jgi:Uma2 family endonuclease
MIAHTIALGPELDWLPDDTWESLVGTIRHQQIVVSTVNSVSRFNQQRNMGWVIGNQLMLHVPRQDRDRPYQASPDILIHTATSFPIDQPTLRVAHYGPPALAIEICSPSTAYQHDLDTVDPEAKPQAYARIGIEEYLVYDPTDTIIRDPPGIRAWQMGPQGIYVPWLPEADGRWHSRLGIAFGVEGVLLRVYDPEGNVVPNNEDMDTIAEAQQALLEARALELAEREAELAARAEQLAEQAARIAELEAELRRRDE